MRMFAILGAAALVAVLAAPAAAQSADAAAPPQSAEDTAASDVAAAAAVSDIAIGQTVKDRTGVTIGTVSDLQADESGGRLATVQMGADRFAVNAASLAVEDGAAVINATEAEIKDMMQK